VWYRANRPQDVSPTLKGLTHLQRQSAPVFTLHDQRSQPFRLARYLGRHKLLIVFFDPTAGAAKNPQLQVLKSGYPQLTAHGEKVIAISSATPYANRESFKQGGDFPFHILSDADYSVETQWGVMDQSDPPKVKPSAFVVDRAGVINWSQFSLKPIPVETLLRELKNAR
jgi:peroxiredoxin